MQVLMVVLPFYLEIAARVTFFKVKSGLIMSHSDGLTTEEVEQIGVHYARFTLARLQIRIG